MLKVVLFEPEIPPNTGNIIRLCANTGAELHLIHPLGFKPDDKQVKRAGLDYHEWTRVLHHDNFPAFVESVKPARILAISTHGTNCYTDMAFQPDDVLLFGPETRGLPASLINTLPKDQVLRIPMLLNSRSLNLSNAVSVVLYEALRQIGFPVLSLK